MSLLSRRRPPPHVTGTPVVRPGPIDGVDVPYSLRFTAAWAWRVLLIIGVVYVFLHLFSMLSVVLVPVIIGLLLAAVGSPIADRLERLRMPRSLATALVVISGIIVIAALITLVTQQISSGFGDLRDSFNESLDKLQGYLTDLGVRQKQLDDFIQRTQDAVQSSGGNNLGGTVLSATTTAGHVVAGLFIVLFSTIFFTYDGRGIWRWFVRLFPASARERVNGSGERAWAVLTSYVRATVLIALVDSLGISLVAYLLGLPLIGAIAVLVFLGSFIPIVGATISGTVAVAVALVSEGPVQALIMLGGVIAVQQIEGHILQPFLLGRLVRVHPLGVVVVIAIGGLVAGIFGALIAVPLTAIINVVGKYLAGDRESIRSEAGEATDPAVTR